ncbi:pentapeptide repeat-containing protein [Mesorhizobium sp.]|uniref:pentapeptide repeat-containing protein n=1 Tax=Mesorhizobium sp. TaxID=1871066 RepID=UPI000FE72A05|nr:pentapeptide repeat-containing protein [Mesorhizobium sp.]RWE85122.1 MAG: pentapeptide repeat-containing protein [Mesorhizobium sp.]
MSEPENNSVQVSRSDASAMIAEALNKERQSTSAQFISQEHRLWPVISNFLQHRSSDNTQLKSAAWSALVYRLFVSGQTTALVVGAGAGAVLTAFIAALGLMAALRANVLVERQNERLDVQNVLNEGQRRSTLLVSELGFIISALPERREPKDEYAEDKPVELPPAIIPRIIALASALRPYPRVEIVASTTPNSATAKVMLAESPEAVTWRSRLGQWIASVANEFFPLYADKQVYRIDSSVSSPERGQLLSTLMLLNVNMKPLIGAGIDFSYAELSDTKLTGDISGINLRRATLTRVSFSECDAGDADLNEAIIRNAQIHSCSFGSIRSLSAAVFEGVEITGDTDFGGWYQTCIIKSGRIDVEAAKLHELYGCRIEQLSADEVTARAMVEYARTAQSGDSLYKEPDPIKLALCKSSDGKEFSVTNTGTCPRDYAPAN